MTHSPIALRAITLAALLAAGAPASAQSPPTLQHEHWEGWYAGVGGGYADHDGPDEGLIGALSTAGFNNPSFGGNLDGTSFKVFVGYRFPEHPLSVEAAYVTLSTLDGDYTVPPPPGGVGGSYDEDTDGWQLLVRAHVWENDDLSAALRLGGWWRETEGDVRAQPGNVPLSYSDEDFDVTAGADLSYRLTDRIGLRGEYERFFMNGKDVDLLTVGVFFDFD